MLSTYFIGGNCCVPLEYKIKSVFKYRATYQEFFKLSVKIQYHDISTLKLVVDQNKTKTKPKSMAACAIASHQSILLKNIGK